MSLRLCRLFMYFAVGACLFFLPGLTAAEDQGVSTGTSKEEKKPERGGVLLRLNHILKTREAVRERVPETTLVGTPESGHIEYNGVRIESLDDDTLIRLLARVMREVRAQQIENMDRMQKQLQSVQNLNKLNALQSSQHRGPVNVPTSYVPPRAHSIPQVPQSPPRVPPQPPRTR
jgi:hypothetical protein